MNLIHYLPDIDQIALKETGKTLSYRELKAQVEKRAQWLAKTGCTRIGIALENSIEWVLFDLAADYSNCILVPIPDFFSAQQQAFLIDEAALELIIHNEPSDLTTPFDKVNYRVIESNRDKQPCLPEGTRKITFTSGSTGTPKGVCLSADNQYQVAKQLVDAVNVHSPIHLCLLPLATLLENIAGVYAPLLAGGTVVLATSSERGFSGSRLTHPEALLQTLTSASPNTLIMVPELLQLLIASAASGWTMPQTVAFIAVGGSKVSSGLLEKVGELGWPVFQGYGLSECASVVALCRQDDPLNCSGTVLPHLKVHTENGEVVVEGNAFLGYLNQPKSFYPGAVYTGDLGILSNKHLQISGRKKNIIINAWGRNISPEWIEAELSSTGLFSQVMVVGDGRAHLGALLVLNPYVAHGKGDIERTLEEVNQRLPDYAQVLTWHCLSRPFSFESGQLTANGKLRRDAILNEFNDVIADLYKDMVDVETML